MMEFVNSNYKKASSNNYNSNPNKVKNKGPGSSSGGQKRLPLSQLQYQQFLNQALLQGQQQFPSLMGGGEGVDLLQQLQASSQNQKRNANRTTKGIKTTSGPSGQQQGDLGSLFQGFSVNNCSMGNKGSYNYVAKKNTATSSTNKPKESQEEMAKRLNIEALKRMDPSFHSLCGSGSQVAVYMYDEAGRDWDDAKTSGPLFLYGRSNDPEYGLVVLNRKGLQNMTIFFNKESQVMPQHPFLLFKCATEGIKGIWFYKESEFHEIVNLLRTIGVQFDSPDEEAQGSTNNSNKSKNDSQMKPSITSNGGSGGGGMPNLFDLLKQSQNRIDGTAGSNSTNGNAPITAEALEQQQMISQGKGRPNNNTERQQSATAILERTTNVALTSLGLGNTPSGNTTTTIASANKDNSTSSSGISLLQQLACPPANSATEGKGGGSGPKKQGALLQDISRSMRTVEQLEKNVTSDDLKKQELGNELLETLGIKPLKDIQDSSSEVGSPHSPFLTPTSGSVSGSERSQKKYTIDDLDGKLYDETDEDMVQEVVESLKDLTDLVLIPENVAGHAEPQLVWRKKSNLQNRPSSAVLQVPSTNGNGMGMKMNGGNGNGTGTAAGAHSNELNNQHHRYKDPPQHKPISTAQSNALTQAQLLQAITYLLQTDPSFITKIHEAYIKSLQQSWGSNSSNHRYD